MFKLTSEQFDQDCVILAQYLIGKVLCRKLGNGNVLKGIIVETEAYLGGEDKASHSYNDKVTERNKPMYAAPGTTYVYTIYGMYHCVNISSKGAGAAVLLRALEPIENIEDMIMLRASCSKKRNNGRPMKPIDLCNGPSKLCMSCNITKDLNEIFLPESDILWVEDSTVLFDSPFKIVHCPRIGIDKCGPEWAGKKLRYYLFNCRYVSKRNRKCEKDQNCIE